MELLEQTEKEYQKNFIEAEKERNTNSKRYKVVSLGSEVLPNTISLIQKIPDSLAYSPICIAGLPKSYGNAQTFISIENRLDLDVDGVHLQTAIIVIEKQIQCNTSILRFVDFRKSFDSVVSLIILSVLQQRRINFKSAELIKPIYNNATTNSTNP